MVDSHPKGQPNCCVFIRLQFWSDALNKARVKSEPEAPKHLNIPGINFKTSKQNNFNF